MSLQDSLVKLQLLMIDLQYTVADVVSEVDDVPAKSDIDILLLQHNARLVSLATDNLIGSAQAALLAKSDTRHLSIG